MTKSTITRERAQQIFLGNGPEPSASEERELARMALAAMDSSESVELPLDYLQGHKDGLEWAAQLAEANHPETGDWLYDDPIELAKAIRKGPDMPPAQPVADSEPVIVVGDDGGDALSYRRLIQSFEPGTKLYRHAQPAPVVPEEMPCGGAADDYHDGYQDGWNACRAAMLQAGTLNNEGTKQAWTGIPDIDNAINMLDRIDTLDSCDDDRIEAVKTVLRRLAGNSPVIPDGYVMVPKEMTDEIGEAIAMQANCCGGIALDIYDAMIAAAPHDTPALNSVQSVVHVSDGWIPVSERMPEREVDVQVYCPDKKEQMVAYLERNELEGYFRFATWRTGEGIYCQPTHWMPLPAGPKEDINALIPLVSRNEQEVK